jgi:hypothetical protein
LFRESESVQDALTILRVFDGLVAKYSAGGRFDPVAQMCTHADRMSSDAFYAGVLLSTMDHPSGPWAEARKSLAVGVNAQARVLVLLLDGTMMQIERAERWSRSDFQAYCSVPGDEIQIGSTGRHWSPNLVYLEDPDTRDLWLALKDLHESLVSALYGRRSRHVSG